ncbi:B12-binding domain-containing radical SAM protein [Paramagnetospirillum kuznetsovii]|nr:radical SAM protein [Paramagnetospirillum kuznetsovii]
MTSAAAAPRSCKMTFVSVESGITALGFRRVAAVARGLDAATDILFIATDNLYSLVSHIFPSKRISFGDLDAEVVGKRLARSDLICFSSMTASSKQVEAIIASIRRHNPKAFVLFGGVHPIIYPEEAMAVADAICVAEGEKPFEMFYRAFTAGEDYTAVPGMWFKTADGIRKTPALPLNSQADLNSFPHIFYGLDCEIYDLKEHDFRPFDKFDYTQFMGLTYRTVWSIGCPFSCTFCANDAFIALDKKYTKLRFPSVDYLLDEIEEGIAAHPYISTVAFYDDNLIALPVDVIREFAQKYKQRIGLPFVVFGVHPNIITHEKFEMLAEAGMNRARMGMQSGNEKMLTFYQRNTKVERIRSSVSILAAAARKYDMIPPAYDIIADNPLETRSDIVETLRFLYELDRPFTLTIFSLRVFPKTKLWEYFAVHPEMGDPRKINSSYLDTRKTMGNVLHYVLGTVKPPKWIFDRLLGFVRGYDEEQPDYPVLHFLAKNIYLTKRAIDHLTRLDFTVIVGGWTYYMWKLGLVSGPKRGTIPPTPPAPTPLAQPGE